MEIVNWIILIAAFCLIPAGVAILLPSNMSMTVFILLLTTLGIACSCIRKVREMK